MNKWNKRIITSIVTSVLFASTPSSIFAASTPSSTTVDVVTLAKTPSALTMNAQQATDMSLPISWQANGNPSNTLYTLEKSEEGQAYTVVQNQGVDDLNEVVSGLAGNKVYYFRVSSYNQDSPPKTNGQYITGQFLTKPSKPATPTAQAEGQDITVEWANVIGTTTKLFDNAAAVTIDANATSKVLQNQTPDTAYQYYVVHNNETGDSVPSDKITVWTDAKVPNNLAVTDSTETSIDISIDSNGNPNTTQYQYRIIKADGTPVHQSTWTTHKTYSFTGLTAGQYKIYAKAKNNVSNPTQKDTAEIELITGTIPTAPAVESVPAENSVEITLVPSSDTTNVEFQIVLFDKEGNEVTKTTWEKPGSGWAADGLTYTFENLNPNQKYQVEGLARYAD